MRCPLRIHLAAALAAAVTTTAFVSAGDSEPLIYAVNHQGHFPDFGDTLIRFHPSDPEAYETIGSLEVPNIGFGGLDFDDVGNLWAYASFNSFGGASSGLYKVDLKTGEATLQGTMSNQTLSDLAWNPTDRTMYGVYTQGFATSRLYWVDRQSGAVTLVGEFSGLDAQHNLIGLAFDSNGAMYIFDNMNKKIYISDDDLDLSLLYSSEELTCEDCELAVGSQGMTIDWSRDDLGYHGAVGQGVAPYYYGNLNTFAINGSSYIWGPEFGENLGDGPFFPPQVQPGDLAIVPAEQTPGDLDGDGTVGVPDLLILLSLWGSCTECQVCSADLDGTCTIGVSDLLILLANWG